MPSIKDIIKTYRPKPLGSHRFFSVLVPLIKIEGEYHLLYEVRSAIVSQPGETSFPGGAVEPGKTPECAAIRETQEELGIPKEHIDLYGEIDFIVNNNHSVIKAYVGEIIDFSLDDITPNEEVASVYTVPLSYFLDNPPTSYESAVYYKHPTDFPFDKLPGGKKYPWKAGTHPIPFYNLEDHLLWGFTARLTHRLADLLKEERKSHDQQ